MSILGLRQRFQQRRTFARNVRRRRIVSRGFRQPAFRYTRAYRGRFAKGYDRTGGFYGRFQQNGELKFFDLDLDDAVVVSTGAITDSINLIPQGVTEKTRVGRKCTIKSIAWDYEVLLPEKVAQATPPAPEYTRIIMYLDRQANGATATVATILASADYQSFNNLANSSRYRTLYDKRVVMNYTAGIGITASQDYPQQIRKGYFYKRCNIPLEFSSTTGAIAEIRSNNIGVLLITRGGLGGFASKIRLRFSDGS